MSFPRYPTYKDSGVEWLGQVPGHWDVLPLKKSFQIVGGSTPKSGTDSFWDGDILWATPSDLSKRESVYINDTQRKITADGLASCGATLVPVASIILSTRAPIGSLAIAETVMCTNQGCKSLVPLESTDSEYFAHLLIISSTELNIRGKGTTFLEISSDELGAFKTPTPPLYEQTKIAAFLDRETAKIDALVAEQRRLMALLKEKRQAVISHAVTQGLNPNAPLKPSGIEWLGDVPAHWAVKKIKFVTASVKAGPFGSALTKDVYVSTGYRVYGQEQVIPNDFTVGDYFITPEKYNELSQYCVSPGDILISCVGTFGKIAIVPDNIQPGIINPRLIRLRCSHAIKAEYLVEVMRSNVTFEQFASFTRGGTMDVINIGTLNEIFIALPPMAEQQELLSFIQHEIAKFDTLSTEAQRAIDLLQERRTALISAAVTGQIDVREFA